MHFGRGLAALALVAAAADAAATCDAVAMGKCLQITRPMLPNAPSAKAKSNFCKYAADYYSCVDGASCITAAMAKECAADFMLAQCSGSDVCKASSSKAGGAASHSAGKEPSSAPSASPTSTASAPVVEDQFNYEKYPPHAPFFGFMGAAFALIFANLGAAYGTAKSGRGISTMGVVYPSLIMKHIIPVVMAGVLGIYGLIIAVIIGSSVTAFKNGEPVYSAFKGFAHLGGGLACGLSGLAAGLAIGVVGDYGVRSAAEQPKLYVGMVLVLIFSEALGLYGLIVGLILTSKE